MPESDTLFAPESVSITCPQCRHAFTARVHRIVDAADESAARQLMGGRLNMVQCPQCGAAFKAPVPILYHDATAEAAYVWIPDGMSSSRDEQEREIGKLTNRVLESLPMEQRKMYLLQPKTFIVEQTFIDAVLEASGISPDELDAARQRGAFVERLVRAQSDDQLQAALDSRPEGLSDYEILGLVHALVQDAAQAGDAPRAQLLAGLYERLTGTLGEPQLTLDDVVDELHAARGANRLEDVVVAIRPALTYEFFAALTEKMEAATGDEAEELRSLRSDVLEILDRLDAETKAEVEAAVELLKAALQATDPTATLRERAAEVTPAFLLVLQANIRAAREGGDSQVAERLEALHPTALEILEDSLPERERVLNRLARAGSRAERAVLLDAHSDVLDAEFVADLRKTASSAESSGAGQAAKNLRDAAAEAEARTQPSVELP